MGRGRQACIGGREGVDRQVKKKTKNRREYSVLEPGEEGVSRRQEQLTMSNAAPRIESSSLPKGK